MHKKSFDMICSDNATAICSAAEKSNINCDEIINDILGDIDSAHDGTVTTDDILFELLGDFDGSIAQVLNNCHFFISDNKTQKSNAIKTRFTN